MKGGEKGGRKGREGHVERSKEMGNTEFSLVDSKGKLIGQAGLYVKRLVTENIRSKYIGFPNSSLSVSTLLNFMPNTLIFES